MSTTLRVLLGDGLGTLRGVGLADYVPTDYHLGDEVTPDNSGVPQGWTPVSTYPNYLTPQTVYVDTPGTVFTDMDMGNTRFVIRCAGTRFIRCRWWVTNNRTNVSMVNTDNANAFNTYMEQCEIVNFDQSGYNYNAVQGHELYAYRCKAMGTCDGFRPNLGGNFRLEGCFSGFLGWWGNDGVPYLNSGNQVHADGVQTQYGQGFVSIGCAYWAYPATWVGTGTPNSGSDAGNTGSWYTQAEAEARRAAQFSVMTDASKSPDGLSHESGGTLTAMMLNRASGQGSTALNVLVTDNTFAGGVIHVNALDANLTSPVGTFMRNKHYNDAFYKVAGKSMGYRFKAGLTGTVPQSGPDMNYYADSGLAVAIVL